MLKASGYLFERHIEGGFGSTLSMSKSARDWIKLGSKEKPAALILTLTTELRQLETEADGQSVDGNSAAASNVSPEKRSKIIPSGNKK